MDRQFHSFHIEAVYYTQVSSDAYFLYGKINENFFNHDFVSKNVNFSYEPPKMCPCTHSNLAAMIAIINDFV